MEATAPADSQTSPAVGVEAATPPPRLIDSDPSKYRSLKQVIVLGRPGSGTDGQWQLHCELLTVIDFLDRRW